MTEKEAKERLNRFKTIKVLYGNTFAMHLEQLEQLQNDIETVLNLLEKKDRTIQQLKDENKALNRQVQQYFETTIIQSQQYDKETMKKDKIIDLMAEKFEDLKIACFKKEDGGEFMGKYRTYSKNDWKQYFERKVEEELNNE